MNVSWSRMPEDTFSRDVDHISYGISFESDVKINKLGFKNPIVSIPDHCIFIYVS